MLYFYRLLVSVVTLLVVFQGDIVSGVSNCSPNANCVINCNATATCNNLRITCPSSVDSKTYSCTVRCLAVNSCVDTMIEVGKSVNVFTFQALQPSVSRRVEIEANGADQVVIACNGASSCDGLTLNMNNGQSMILDVTSSSSELGVGQAAFGNGTFNIDNTTSVWFGCDTKRACASHRWTVDRSQNVTVECNGEYACDQHTIMISRAVRGIIQASTPLPSLTQDNVSLVDVSSVVIQTSDNAIQNGFFSLRNIDQFLLNIADSGSSFGARWKAENVSSVAINTWHAVSYWLVDGMPFQSSYTCSPAQDCNIRVDSTSNLTHLDIQCPDESSSPTKVHTTCLFYCTAVTGCSPVHLSIIDTTNVGLYFNEAYNPDFILNANSLGVTDTKTTLNMTCDYPYSCANGSYSITGYDTVVVSCLDYFACEASIFTLNKISTEAKIMSNSQGMYEAGVWVSNSLFAFVTSEDTHYTGLAFRQTHWVFDSVQHVHAHCGHNADCANSTFTARNVQDMWVWCGSGGLTGDSCANAVFNNQDNTSFDLTCQEGDFSCDGTQIYYDGSSAYNTFCEITCKINPNNPANPNCRNMDITVNNNDMGYEAITLTCLTEGIYTACENVIVTCNTDSATCQCPILYDDIGRYWTCDGQCGTSPCTKSDDDDSSSGLSAGATAAIVLLVLIVVGVAGFFAYQRYRKGRVESQLFVPLGKQTVPTVQGNTGNYQTL